MYNPTEKFDTLRPAKSPKRFLKSKILQGLGATSGGWAPFPTNTERNIERKILLQAPGTLAPASGGGGGTPATGLLNGLIGYWKLDEASGSPRADSTGNGWTATEFIRAVPNIAGIIGNAQKDPFTLPMGLAVSASIDTRAATAPFSYSIWYYYQGSRDGDTMFGEWNSGTNDWRFVFNHGTFALSWQSLDASAVLDSLDTVITYATNVWTHVVLVFDGTTKKIYVNGSQDAHTSTVTGIRRGHNRLITDNDESQAQQPNSHFDEAGYWSVALTQSQVAQLYNGGSGLPFSSFT